MSRTKIHILKGKFNNGYYQDGEIPFDLQKMFDRANFEIGYDRALRQKIVNKISLSEMNNEIQNI